MLTDEMRETIAARITQMEADLTAFVAQVNQQIAAQQGGIEALKLLLAEADSPPDEAAE